MKLFSRPRFRFVFAPSCALFVPSLSPGPVLRLVERNALGARPAFARGTPNPDTPSSTDSLFPVLLSGPAVQSDAHPPWRVLCLEDVAWRNERETKARSFIQRLGSVLSQGLGGVPVYELWVTPSGGWLSTKWSNGDEIHDIGEARRPELVYPWPRWFPDTNGLHKAPAPLPSLLAWANELGLPLMAARRYARVVDYETVAGLERKGLLVENEPVWYRYTTENQTGGIIRP